jgi:dsDNA-binding SOS-regulon protein
MIESIGLAIAKTLASYLFKTYVATTSKVYIEGAPKWYMQNVSSHVCVYNYKTGGMEAVEIAKAGTYPKMQTELSNILEAVIYEKYSDLKDPKEKQFVLMFKNDKDAPIFIRSKMDFKGIEYTKKYRTAFVKACIDKNDIIMYQEKRIGEIKYELTHKRANDAFDELESGDMSLE